ncbi:hypothetical protein MMC27_003211 [Xylographa pallens]|nr:hypothetical protein [Xylographa pallens]
MCKYIIGERHSDNLKTIRQSYYKHCKSIDSCFMFASLAKHEPWTANEVAAKLAERERQKAESRAAALLRKHIEDGKRTESLEDRTVMSEAEWVVMDTDMWEKLEEGPRSPDSLVDDEESWEDL